MAKTLLGIDIGYESMKLALVSGRRIKKTAIIPMPVNLVKEGRVVSTETMGELLRTSVKKQGMKNRLAALTLASESVFIRNVTMPQMTEEQLKTNLPFEFRDYISDELKNYVFDYAMISADVPASALETEGEQPGEATGAMDLLAVAAPTTLIEESREYLRKAGMVPGVIAPAVCSFVNIIRAMNAAEAGREYCILDLGYRAIRMHMFRGDKHVVTRLLEVGLDSLDEVIAEQFNVDVHLAHTYLVTNYEGCQNGENCANAFTNIAVELLRAINFYRFSNPDSTLSDVYLCGGGAAIGALGTQISDHLDMNVHHVSELIEGANAVENCDQLAQAIGIALN